jgi:hypothetical protein
VRLEHGALEELAGDVRCAGRHRRRRAHRVAGAAIGVAEATALYEGAIPRALGERSETA